jgi:hypothetical protein
VIFRARPRRQNVENSRKDDGTRCASDASSRENFEIVFANESDGTKWGLGPVAGRQLTADRPRGPVSRRKSIS